MATTKIFEGFVAKARGVPGAAVDFDYVGRILLGLIALYIIGNAFQYLMQYLMATIAQNTVYAMRQEVEAKFDRLPLKFFDTRTRGEVMSRAVNDLDSISGTLQQNLTQLLTSVLTLIGVIVMMLTISWMLTLVIVLTLPLSIVIVARIAKRSQKFFMKQQMALGALNGHVAEMYGGHTIVTAFGHEQKSVATFETLNENYYDGAWRAQFVSGIILPTMMFVGNLGYVLVAVIGGVLVTRGSIPIGDVQAFIAVQPPVLDADHAVERHREHDSADGRVGGARVRIAGRAGGNTGCRQRHGDRQPAGRRAVRRREFPVQGGRAAHRTHVAGDRAGPDDRDRRPDRRRQDDAREPADALLRCRQRRHPRGWRRHPQLKRGALRRMFGMVLQDTWLFSGTIRENIAYGREHASEEAIVNAAKAAQADHFIRTLPDNYDTPINEEASNLSQGQKQLLTIARAFLADPAILILDEATSSVDTRTEILIQQAMGRADARQDDVRHRAPAVDDSQRRRDPDDGTRPDRRERHASRAARGEGPLRGAVSQPVRRADRAVRFARVIRVHSTR